MTFYAKALADEVPKVVEAACFSVEAFVENMKSELLSPYAPNLMAELFKICENAPPAVKMDAITAISAVAHSQGS